MPAKSKETSQPPEHPLADLSMLGTDDVAALLHRERTAIHRLRKNDPDFPQPIRIRNQPYWFVSELRAYIKAKADERPSVRRAAAKAAAPNTTTETV